MDDTEKIDVEMKPLIDEGHRILCQWKFDGMPIWLIHNPNKDGGRFSGGEYYTVKCVIKDNHKWVREYYDRVSVNDVGPIIKDLLDRVEV